MTLRERLCAFSSNVALIKENLDFLSYSQLINRADDIVANLSQERSLIFIEADSSFDSICAYIGALINGHVVMLLDPDLSADLKDSLYSHYSPNYIYKNGSLLSYSNMIHDLHSDLALMLSTSGSTGAPKLVKLTQENILANASSIAEYLKLECSDRAVTSLPLHYSYGLSILNSHLYSGASIFVTKETLFSKCFWSSVNELKITSLSGVPYTYEMLKRLKIKDMTLPHIRFLTQAGGKMSEAMIKEFYEVSKGKGWDLFVMYGQTEATARMSYLPPNLLPNKIGSIGRAIPGGSFEVNKLNSLSLEGEIVYRGPNVMLGYAKNVEDLSIGDELNSVLNTGDIGFKDNDGDLFITGRKSRFIKLFGLRFSLDQIENELINNKFEIAVGGVDEMLKIATTELDKVKEIKAYILKNFKLNHRAVNVFHVEKLPLKSNGKVDYQLLFGEKK